MLSGYYCTLIDFGTPEFDEALKLRDVVLRKPLNMQFDPADIAQEYDSFHVACYKSGDDSLAAVLILKPLSDHTLKMRQVAVDPSLQSHGVGSYLVTQSEVLARSRGYLRIELHARNTAVTFYKKLGYETRGEVFKEVGIDHYFMEKNI